MPNGTCSTAGCSNPIRSRGLCAVCYSRLRKSGELPLLRRPTAEERLFAAISESSSGCWLWEGARAGTGYGQFQADGQTRPAHRVVYEFFIGEIPEGLDLDHLCRVRRCVNPWHLDPVTRRINIIRGDAPKLQRTKTHCPHGHPYDAENTTFYRGRRFCRACKRQRQRALQEKKRGTVNGSPLDAR